MNQLEENSFQTLFLLDHFHPFKNSSFKNDNFLTSGWSDNLYNCNTFYLLGHYILKVLVDIPNTNKNVYKIIESFYWSTLLFSISHFKDQQSIQTTNHCAWSLKLQSVLSKPVSYWTTFNLSSSQLSSRITSDWCRVPKQLFRKSLARLKASVL